MTAAVSALKYQIFSRRLGLWIFIVSESIIFLALLSTRFYMVGTARPAEVNQILGFVITIILLASSVTANRAEVCIAHEDRTGFVRNLLATIVLGLIFLGVVVSVEWPEALRFAPPATGYGTVFFATTGVHAFHVLTGAVILSLVLLSGRRGRYTAADHWGAEAGIIYWHFVDVVWVFVYPTLYLLGS